MCTNYQNLRARLREENAGEAGRRDGGGDGFDSSTLIQEIGFRGVLTAQSPFLLRLTISSVVLIIFLLLSKQLEWAAFIFDIAKPIYCVYIAGIAIVDVFGPVLRKFDRWLITPPSLTSLDTPQSLNTSSSEDDDSTEVKQPQSPISQDSSPNLLSPSWSTPNSSSQEDDAVNNNNLDFVFPDICTNVESCPGKSFSGSDKSKRSLIPAPINKNRQVKSRGRSSPQGETNTKLLRALESEIRKETKLPKKCEDESKQQ